MGFGSIGGPELLILLAVVLLIFGPKNLPKLANAMGRAINDFKKGLSGVDRELQAEIEREDAKAAEAKTLPAQNEAVDTAQTQRNHESA